MHKFLYILVALLFNQQFVFAEGSSNYSIDGIADQVSLPITFQIKDQISISGYRYFLSDLAECNGYDKLCEEIYAIELGKTPEPGRIEHYHRDKLLKILNLEWPQHTISIVGPQLIKISPVVYQISQHDVQRLLLEAVDEAMVQRSDVKVNIHSVRMNSSIKTLSQDYILRFPEIDAIVNQSVTNIASKFSGTPNLTVELYPKELGLDIANQRFRILVKLDVSAKLPVALKPMSRGDHIDPLDFEYQWVELSRSKNKFETSLVSIDGYELKVPLKVGDPLPLGKVKKAEAIKRGEITQMLIEKGSLTIKAKVKMRQSGSVGDVVDAEYLGTRKKLQVEILDKHTVKYRF